MIKVVGTTPAKECGGSRAQRGVDDGGGGGGRGPYRRPVHKGLRTEFDEASDVSARLAAVWRCLAALGSRQGNPSNTKSDG